MAFQNPSDPFACQNCAEVFPDFSIAHAMATAPTSYHMYCAFLASAFAVMSVSESAEPQRSPYSPLSVKHAFSPDFPKPCVRPYGDA